MPGVLAVLTRDNLNVASNSFGAYVSDQQIIATDKVRYVGDMVAAVAATDAGIAAEAVRLIEVDYEELAAVFTHRRRAERRRAAGAREARRPQRSGLRPRRHPYHPRSTAIFVFTSGTIAATSKPDCAPPIQSLKTLFTFPARSIIRWSPTSASRSSRANADGVVGHAKSLSSSPRVGARLRSAV